jgi:hypothetical protein
MTSLRESGWRLVLTGETTLDEVLRAAADEDDSIQIPVPAKAISSSVEQGRS